MYFWFVLSEAQDLKQTSLPHKEAISPGVVTAIVVLPLPVPAITTVPGCYAFRPGKRCKKKRLSIFREWR